jgi:uncharacterized protein (DUF608 family)
VKGILVYQSAKIGAVLLAVIMSSFVFAQEQKAMLPLPSGVVERLNDPALMAQGDTKIYSGKYLDAISMPVGGMGAGCLQMNGHGERAIWQIFNNFCNAYVADSFFAVRCKENNGAAIRALQTTAVGPFTKMDSLTFRGEYPFGLYSFDDANFPVKVSMEVFSPLIPSDAKNSAIPCAIFNVTVSNPTNAAVEVSLLSTQKNAVGFAGCEHIAWSGPADGVVFADFEGADYGNWEIGGTAFGNTPSNGAVRPEQLINGFKGKGMVNTYREDGDITTGRLKSPNFTITKNFICFLIAGGPSDTTCINLYVDNQKVAKASGNGNDNLKWRSWDVTQFKGKTAYIEIVDQETGGWGHIDVDQIVFSDESEKTIEPKIKVLGQNRNKIVKENDNSSLFMTIDRKKYDDDKTIAEKFCAATGIDKLHYDGALGSMTLMAVSNDGQGIASWADIEELHKNWVSNGQLTGPDAVGPSEDGKTYNGALSVPFTLQPSESKTVTFILTWYFPNVSNGLNDGKWDVKGNMYSNWWTDSIGVAKYVKDNLKDLSAKTRLYHDTFYKSNLPRWLLDRVSSQVAILDSKTFFWSQNDYFGCWEGCSRSMGCCAGNCSHVYHYAQSHAYLFPSLARKMREQVFSKQYDDGRLSNRNGYDDVATDGMCGEILSTYREYLMCDSNDWLNANWSHVRKAMDHVIVRWDTDEDGVLSGMQWNTLDSPMSGNSPWLGSLYLSALEASEKMALLQHDPKQAERYKAIRISGAQKQNDRLWNGEYYIQIPEANLPAQNTITGCNIDQVIGEWWANKLGFEGHYPADRVRSSLNSLLRYNFRCNFVGIEQKPRKFVADEDAGLQMTCWPNKGDRPALPTPYGDEVMTGFEYSAAAAMVQFGMLKEGLMVTKAVYDRYDGRLRSDLTDMEVSNWGYTGNPFGDDECGKFYGRALSVWSLLQACQGYYYNGPEKIIGFEPQWQPDNHASFFTGAQGWGLFEQKRSPASQVDVITVAYGKLTVAEIRLGFESGRKIGVAKAVVAGKSIPVKMDVVENNVELRFKEPVTLEAGQSVQIQLDVE